MAYLSDKEQYYTYKEWPDLVLSLQQGGSEEVAIQVTSGCAIALDDGAGVFLKFSVATGFKNAQDAKQCFIKFSNKDDKKLFRDIVKVSRLEKYIAGYFAAIAEKKQYFTGELFFATPRKMQQFEMGDDSKAILVDLFDPSKLAITEETFDIPTGTAKKQGNSFTPKETEKERLMSRLEFYAKESIVFPYDTDLLSCAKDANLGVLQPGKKQLVCRMAFTLIFQGVNPDVDQLIKLADYLYDK